MQWFENWFDTPYYKMLYQHRNEEEAQIFIHHLFQKIPLQKDFWILDLACGRGRHAKFIHQLGYQVYGIDLSYESIREAQKFQNDQLIFEVQDMRNFSLPIDFQLILSLFTSFGYFEELNDNLKVLHQVYKHLQINGFFVLDFFNVDWVIHHMVPSETKIIDHIEFNIHKYIENQRIIKEIIIHDKNNVYHFCEKVHLFKLEDLIRMLQSVGLQVISYWGDYSLNAFTQESPRCILLTQKN